MAKTIKDIDLNSNIKEIDYLISPKNVNKLSLDDLKALYLLSNNIQYVLSDILYKIFPDLVVNNKTKLSSIKSDNKYNDSISKKPNNYGTVTSIPADMGTGFSAGGIGLYDVTNDIINDTVNNKLKETIQANNPDITIEEKPIEAELEILNEVFGNFINE